MSLYTELLYRPLLNTLFFLYDIVPAHDMGVAIVLLTILVRLLLLAPTLKSTKAQRRLMELQPKVEALKKQHANNKELLAKELMELYKQERVNPLSSCLPLVIQLPFLLALYGVFRDGLVAPKNGILYSFIARPEAISPLSFGLLDLSKPSIPLILVTAVAQYVQTRMLPITPVAPVPSQGKDEARAAALNKQMQFMGPVLTVVIGYTLPSALMLYWLVSTAAQIAVQWYGLRGAVTK